MAKVKMKHYIYHYCLNENLPKEHPDFCFNCWVDECGKLLECNLDDPCPDCEDGIAEEFDY